MATQLARCIGLIVMLALVTSGKVIAQPHGADAGTAGWEPKPYALGGYLETTHAHYQLNRDSAFYRVEFAGQPQRATLDHTTATLRLAGSARAGDWHLRFQSRGTLERDQLARDTVYRFDELAASWKPHRDFTLEAGKMALKWGKGHTWNPLAFVERPKDASDPRLPREGYGLITATLNHNFTGRLQSLTFSPVLLPVSENLNHDFGKPGHLNAAAKLQLDYGDTDLGFYFLNHGSRAGRFGLDFSHHVSNDLEIYGEWARIESQDFRLATPTGISATRTQAATSYLVGMQWRTQRRSNLLVEFHHNGTGYSADEYRDFVALVNNAAQAGADSSLMARAQTLARGGLGRAKVMQDYLYLRLSQGAAPLTPSIRMTLNLQDGSYSFTPELLYNAQGHWGLRARVTVFGGGGATEYGEKYYSRRAELRLHYHF